MLARLGKVLSVNTKLNIYKIIISPHFQYCSTILMSLNNEDMRNLQIKQNKALRIILGCSRYTRIVDMFQVLNLLNVKQKIVLNVFIFIYKMSNNLLPKHLLENCQFVRDIHNYSLEAVMQTIFI